MPQLSIPVESYSALEQLVQTLQVEILLAAAKSSEPITVDTMRQAISQITATPQADRRSVQEALEKEFSSPEPQAYLWLDRRLDNVRDYVFRFAKSVAQDAHLKEVSPEAIRTCWKSVFSSPSLVKKVLNPDFPPAE